MKKLLLLFCSLMLCYSLTQAQTIPNPGFEKWSMLLDYQEPSAYWLTSNRRSLDPQVRTATVMPPKEVTVFPVQGYMSSRAIHLEVKTNGYEVFPAFITNSAYNWLNPKGGQTYEGSMPAAVTGYYRCRLNTDKAYIEVGFKKNGVVLGIDTLVLSGNQPAFTAFSLPVNLSVVPDTVIITSCIGGLSTHLYIPDPQATVGSWLELDGIGFSTALGTEPLKGGDFESWSTRAAHVPEGWYDHHYNSQFMLRNLKRTTDRFSGEYAVQLTTVYESVLQEVTESGISVVVPISAPVANHKDSLVFYYKYSTPGKDEGWLRIGYYSTVDKKVNKAFYHMLPASPDFKRVALDMTDRPADANVVQIIFKSSDPSPPKGVAGSTLILDDVDIVHTSPSITKDDSVQVIQTIEIYPNPAHRDLTVTNAKGLDYRISDIAGRIVARGHIETDKVNVKPLTPGTFILSVVKGNKEVATKKFVKQ